MILNLEGTQATQGTLTIDCGSRSSPQKTSSFLSTSSYNEETGFFTGEYYY